MRVAVVADIHGNRVALETVLGDISQRDVDSIICLGDIAALGPDPAGCLDLVFEVSPVIVMGNTDDWLLQMASGETLPVSDTPVVNDIVAWACDQLSEDQLRRVATLPRDITLTLSRSTTMLAFHGSPRSWDEVVMATTPDPDLDEIFGEGAPDILVGGHTHVPMLRRYGERVVINPGSVGLPGVGPGVPGLPVNTDVHWAEYAIVECSAEGASFEFYRLPISIRQMILVARQSGMPGLDWWKDKWRRMP